MLDAPDRSVGRNVFRHVGAIDGVTVTLSYALDAAEHDRRQVAGVGALTDEFLLAALVSLPSDDLARVDERFTRVLASPGASQVAWISEDPEEGLWGRRLVNCPVEIIQLETELTTWRRGCELVQPWVGYGPRIVHATDELDPFELSEAAHYGIGVVHPDGHRLLDPGDYRPQRWGSARWRFAELVYEQFLALRS
jgi:hypothetical protein